MNVFCKDRSELVLLQKFLIKQKGYLWNGGEDFFLPSSIQIDPSKSSILMIHKRRKKLSVRTVVNLKDWDIITFEEYMRKYNNMYKDMKLFVNEMFDDIL